MRLVFARKDEYLGYLPQEMPEDNVGRCGKHAVSNVSAFKEVVRLP